MSERLCSVGIDVGTTSTQMIVSELILQNRASSFAVPEIEIAQRRILYRSPVYFTPLLAQDLVDGEKLRILLEKEYCSAGICRENVDTGAVIITGETSRKENAQQVLQALSDLAGEFVVATAGPDLESVLAAKGAGAQAWSEHTGKTVLHMDIGGGTSNLALIRDGKIVQTGCLNVGGRLLKFDESGKVFYVSPVLDGISSIQVGDSVNKEMLEQLAQTLVQVLEMAAGLRPRTMLLDRFITNHTVIPEAHMVISFSGGVADCIESERDWKQFGDLGPVLGHAIRDSRLCAGEFMLGQETIRATVIGAGCHSAQLSGSTVFCRGISFPLKNLPVVKVETQDLSGVMADRLRQQDDMAVLAMEGPREPGYGCVQELGARILAALPAGPVLVALEQDMAKALGQTMALRTDRPILCIDRVRLSDGDYLDVGVPAGPAFPLVVKTLIFTG